jgi:ubiquinol-cytochrome c reductase cytochrome b subunit
MTSIEKLCRNLDNGWLMRYIHSNGASFFFIVVYVHIIRGLYYGSYKEPRNFLWLIGSLILTCMIITAFFGYVLPWGQMSFWGATVITNLFSAIPVFGLGIVQWIWGGFSVNNATLNRFYSFHFALPFLLIALVGLHLIILHIVGSSNPLSIDATNSSLIPFHSLYTIKDLFWVGIFLVNFAILVFFKPNILSHPDNYIEANPLVTPPHIVPEWYFLLFYAVLRSIPDKLLGVLGLVFALLLLYLLPLLGGSSSRGTSYLPFEIITFWFFVFIVCILGYIGGQPIEYPFLQIGQISSFSYFGVYTIISTLNIILNSFYELF